MISTHILDTSLGNPAAGVKVELARYDGANWHEVDSNMTNADGRIQFNCSAQAGVYRLKFLVEDYFKKQNIKPFFLRAPVIFEISDVSRKYHIPLLLNPYGYSTYRGS